MEIREIDDKQERRGDLEAIGAAAFANAVAKGFYEDYERVLGRLDDPLDRAFVKQIWLSHRLMLIVSECAEGLEGIRNADMSCRPKSGGLCEELADVQIRLSDLNHHLRQEYPVQYGTSQTVLDKMKYNSDRPRKHNKVL
jgi:hypothetical protein